MNGVVSKMGRKSSRLDIHTMNHDCDSGTPVPCREAVVRDTPLSEAQGNWSPSTRGISDKTKRKHAGWSRVALLRLP